MDNMFSHDFRTAEEVRGEVAARFKARRLALNLAQRELAARSGVTGSSLKRFEQEGRISLESLIHLAAALGCLSDFDRLAEAKPAANVQSLDALLAAPKARRRASRG